MVEPSSFPDAEVLAWVEVQVGPCQVVSRFAHDHGYSQLWRLSAGGEYLWLKMHAYPHKWAGEVHALARWTPQLGQTPRLIAWRRDPNAVLLSETDGVAAESLDLTTEAEERMWREAGEWLSKLHQIENDWLGNVQEDGTPHGEPADDPEAFVGANWQKTLRDGIASGLFTQKEIEFTEGRVREGLPTLKGERPRALHRDYTPRNWMALPDGTLTSVIDFEHARWDIRAADLNRPWDHEFRRNPRLADAFCDGYGGLPALLKEQIETLRTMLAFSTIVWATKVGDGAFAQRYRDALSRMMTTAA
jgi:Ser/Thr protein kinase RdoA (MazF antagonist)